MQIRVGRGPQGGRWAWTEGLGEYDQQDFALPMTWHEGDWRDKQARKVLDFISNYVQTHPKRILAEQTMRYGWTTLTFRPSAPDESPDGRPRHELFLDDALHFNAHGYVLLADRVRPFLSPPPRGRK